MRAFVYIALIAAILWSGLAWEQAHAPIAVTRQVNEAAETQPTTEPQTSGVEVERRKELTADRKVREEQKALLGSQATIPPAVLGDEDTVYDEGYVEALETSIHVRINEERKKAGLNSLAYDKTLAEVAAYHSTDMAKEDYFAHEDEDGCNVSCRVNSAGYSWRMVGENLFMLERGDHFSVEGASALIVAGWMGSEGHRKNILQPRFTYEGIGVVIRGDAIYATEVFARPR